MNVMMSQEKMSVLIFKRNLDNENDQTIKTKYQNQSTSKVKNAITRKSSVLICKYMMYSNYGYNVLDILVLWGLLGNTINKKIAHKSTSEMHSFTSTISISSFYCYSGARAFIYHTHVEDNRKSV